ncbi:alpha/beta hydrolase [Rubrivivax gelatinosus]|uniref:Alpha/beta hydrolase n=1 Tax=Rubrivivax gelatinosus TaxID=28068 RepID=A0ABS1DPD1_RUBGE|nr:alpha/beta hydrolase [Rubrivivax gelatinosus]MBK1711430.1 alpha/beta hydrolase [Rubrivivax gelatinosus]
MATQQFPIVFSHANGFPAGTYRVLFEHWRAAGREVLAVPRYGHDPRYPVTGNWPHIRQQLLDFVEQAAPGRRVHFVGHSLGGYLSLMAACKRPDSAAGVVMLDSPVLAGWRAHSVQVAKATRLIGRISPGKVSQARRQHWPTAEATLQHFAQKSVFARWDPRVLADYVASGTEPDPAGGVRLAFHRDVETRFYNTLPHHLGELVRRHPPRCPVAFVGGTVSAEVRQVGMAATRAVCRGQVEWIAGSHLVPMEQPIAVADAVLARLAAAEAAA